MNELKTTSLYEEHLKLGARMCSFAGFNMPIQYSGIKNEVNAVRSTAGVFDVSHMGEFLVEGPQSHEFVDYIITNEFKSMPNGKAIYSPLCNEEGYIVDDLIAYKLSDQKVLICVNAANIKKDWDWISQFVGQFDCKLTDLSESYSLLAVQGPKVEKILKSLKLIPESNFAYYSAIAHQYKNEEIIIARTGYTGEDGVEIFCSHELVKSIWKSLLELDVIPCGLAARDVLRLEVCYPLYGHELNDSLTPFDGGIGWTVKKDKNNFVGKQALISKPPQFRLIKLSLERGIPREGYSVLNSNGDIIGKVTSGTMSVSMGKGIALALVERSKMPEDKIFSIDIRNKAILAKQHKSPFVTGGHK